MPVIQYLFQSCFDSFKWLSLNRKQHYSSKCHEIICAQPQPDLSVTHNLVKAQKVED